MSDKKHKNSENPFAKLDHSHFPAEREKRSLPTTALKKNKISSAKSAPNMIDMSEINQNEDAELFLQAVSASAPLPFKDGDFHLKRPPVKIPACEPSIKSAIDNDVDVELARAFRQTWQNTPPPEKNAPAKKKDFAPVSALAEAMGLADTEGESRDFFKAVKDVAPLSGKGREVPPEPQPAAPSVSVEDNPLQNFVDGTVEFALSGSDEFMEGHVAGLDLLTVGRLQARHYNPDAHIDLHGLNSEQALHLLVGFFRNAYYKGVRTALVVTGRGLNSPNCTPVLRTKVQDWFTQEPFRRVILAFCTAKQEDGGAGAFYVLLRKYRKNSGKIRWDAMPVDDLFM